MIQNDPEYILTEEMATVALAVQAALQAKNVAAGNPAGWPVLNYQYGHVEELNETLKQYEKDPARYNLKFPLIWLAEPYEISIGEDGIYGIADPDIFIFNGTEKTWKAADRMTNNYTPILLPIYRELKKQIVISTVFNHTTVESIRHRVRKGYYWDEQQKIFNDAVDCLKISGTALRIHNKYCTPTKSF